MLFVINKEKVLAYAVSVITVVILFCATNILNENSKKENIITTSTNIKIENIKNDNSSLNNENNGNNMNINENTGNNR